MARELTTLRHDIYRHPVIAALPVAAHFTYVMLWHLADHEGRLPDNLRTIDAVVHHHRPNDTCREELQVLATAGAIIRYTAPDGTQLIQIADFGRWFTVGDSKFVASLYPPPPNYTPPEHKELPKSPKKRKQQDVRTSAEHSPDNHRTSSADSAALGRTVEEAVAVGVEVEVQEVVAVAEEGGGGGNQESVVDQPVTGPSRVCAWLPHRAEVFSTFPNPILPLSVAERWEDLLGDVPDDLVPVMAGFIRAQQRPVLMIGTLVGIASRDDLGGEQVALAIRDLTMRGIVVPTTRQLATFAKHAEDEARQNRVARASQSVLPSPKPPERDAPPRPDPAPSRGPVRPVVPLPGSSAARSGPQSVTPISAILPTIPAKVTYDA